MFLNKIELISSVKKEKNSKLPNKFLKRIKKKKKINENQK